MARYKLTKQGVQDLLTTQFIENMQSREGRKYQKWLAEGNKPLPMDEPQALVVDENEAKIQAELRKMAIANLGAELPDGYK